MRKESLQPNLEEMESLTVEKVVNDLPHDATPWLEAAAVGILGIDVEDG